MNLADLIALSKETVRKSVPESAPGYSKEDIAKLVDDITIGAIKFQDMKNNIASGYVFDLEDFAKFDGKTGPYIQYAIARINSIIRKAQESNIKESKIVISNEEERNLALKIAQLNATVMRAHNDKEPSIIADYAYTLAQSFSSFYNASSIVNAETPDLAGSRLKLARLVRDILKLQLYLLGIASPEAMLKSQEAAA